MAESIARLIEDLLPHAPELGLYVRPSVPADKRANALRDYAHDVKADDVLAVYDATLRGNAKDGAVFTIDRLVYQNNDFSPPQEIRYEDIVHVSTKKKFIGGRKVYVDANRGRATVTFSIDFSGRPKAADFVARFLHEAMMFSIMQSQDSSNEPEGGTDLDAVKAALTALREDGKLSDADYRAMIAAVRQ